MAIATLGDLVFEASSELVRTFADASLTTSARWTAHEVIGQRPVQEFGGPALRSLSLSLRLDSGLGVDPEAEAKALRQAVEDGTVLPLILGGEPSGDWVATSMAESWRHIGADGRIGAIDVALSLQEYV